MAEMLTNAYALVVGIADYEHIRKLPYTADAADVAALLGDAGICGYTTVETLSEAAATGPEILAALDRLAGVPPDSTVLIYFSGHGASLKESGAYLLPFEAVYPRDEELRASAISSEDFNRKLDAISLRAGRLTVILDCCHAGGITGVVAGKELGAENAEPGLSGAAIDALSRGVGRVVFAAALPDSPAYVRDGARHGNFTECLIRALRGEAGGSRGLIRISDLMSYLTEGMAQATPPQEPCFKFEGVNYPIARHLGGGAGSGATVKGGLEALIRLAGDPSIHAEIVAIRGRLEAAHARIGTVVALKSLHDRLHDIQVNQFDQIFNNERPRLPDRAASENVSRLAKRLLRGIDPMRDDAARAYPGPGPVEWIEALRQAAEGLVSGGQGPSLDAIDDGIWGLDDVLSNVPSRVNTDLRDRIREMDLRALFRALLGVQDRMAGLAVPADEARKFAAGGADLGRLDREFNDLMDQHDDWQEVDNWMRPIEKNLRGNPRELDSACPRLTRKVGTLLDAVPDRRRAELRAACDELDARLARKADLPDKLAAFRDLRDAAVQWFYDLDRLLMGRCEELTLINAALGAVLDIVIGAKP